MYDFKSIGNISIGVKSTKIRNMLPLYPSLSLCPPTFLWSDVKGSCSAKYEPLTKEDSHEVAQISRTEARTHTRAEAEGEGKWEEEDGRDGRGGRVLNSENNERVR